MISQILRVEPLSRIVLYELYSMHAEGDEEVSVTPTELSQRMPFPVSVNLLRSALQVLRSEPPSLVTKTTNPITKASSYRISLQGIFVVEEGLRDNQSDLSYYRSHGADAVADLVAVDGAWGTDVERLKSDYYVPIEIDRDEQAYKEAVQAVEEAIRKLKADNSFSVSSPNERDGLVATLQEGAEALKTGSPTKWKLISTIIEPLKFIVVKFAGTLIEDAAKRAVSLLFHWLS